MRLYGAYATFSPLLDVVKSFFSHVTARPCQSGAIRFLEIKQGLDRERAWEIVRAIKAHESKGQSTLQERCNSAAGPGSESWQGLS